MKIDIILMAAGNSRRFRTNKILYIFKGKITFENILEKCIWAKEKIKDHTVDLKVVTRFKKVEDICEKHSVFYFHNEDSQKGASFTVKKAIELSQNADFIMFAVCDEPYIKKETILRLIEETLDSKKGIGMVSFGERKGNPVMFSKKYFSQFKDITGDKGGKEIIKNNMEDVYFCVLKDEKELEDADEISFFDK